MIHLLNKLFGWDYVYWQNTASNGTARVYESMDGRVFYYRYKTTGLIDVINTKEQVLWLTCEPSKYGFSDKKEENK